jgi:hypothetical protein
MWQGLNNGGSSIQNGLGPVISGLAQNGTRGQQLASVVQDLQSARRTDRARDRDIAEDRREVRDDERRLRDDQRRLARDRNDLRQDLRQDGRDRDDRPRDRDVREDRREVRDDERRVREDERRLARDREDLRQDVRDRAGDHRTPAPAGTAAAPTLPSNLHLPPQATSSLTNGLNSSGTATRHGMGWIVSDMTHQGVHGQQLSDAIHQLKPYKQQGVLTFPQSGQTPAAQPQLPFQPPAGQGILGKIRGKGKG